MGERMTYVPPFRAEDHDPDCGAHFFEPCDCASGIVSSALRAFSDELKRILASQHKDAPNG